MLFLMIKTVKLTQKNELPCIKMRALIFESGSFLSAGQFFLLLFVLLAEEGGGGLHQLLLGHIGHSVARILAKRRYATDNVTL